MKLTQSLTLIQFKNQRFWLSAIGVGIIAVHQTLAWKSNNSDIFGTSCLFWIAISSLIWDRRHKLNLDSGAFPSFFGLSLIAVILLKSSSVTSLGKFLYISPLILAFGLALIASGFKGLKQYQGELLVLFTLGLPKILPFWMMNITVLTAKAANFILWYTGFSVIRSGTNIYLPTGSIEVARGCSGIELIFQMLGFALLFLLMFPQNLLSKIFLPICAIGIGFIVNAGRVAVMAVVVAQGNHKQTFDFWHHGDGSLIFSMIAVLIFSGICWFVINRDEPKNKHSSP
ncbi:MAG: cyanoexosortase A [Cyanobacteria bacterium P01_A01_bin.84]